MKKLLKTFTHYIVFVSITAVTLFTIAAFVLQFVVGVEVSSTLITCWFSFWGVEIISLMAIKTHKIKHQKDKEEEVNG